MKDDYLKEFGILLMKSVRDGTISSWDKILDGQMKGLTAQEVRDKIGELNQEQLEIVKWLIPKIVDQSLHKLLFMFEENEELLLGYRNGKEEIINIVEESDGLSGELYTEDGWIQQFSKERYSEIE